MTVRAGVYIRTSTARQSDGVSPDVQRAECLELCAARGYTVVAVYEDITKYRVGRKLVEPSGTRPDRPAFRKMLADMDAKLVDTVVAWREDRLYRGLRPMLDFVETLERSGADCALVTETFDRKFSPVKAWVARMELDSIAERMSMGVRARLQAGRLWSVHVRYGYQLDEGGNLVVDEPRARWVRQVFSWYLDRVPIREIRRRLTASAPPPARQSGNRRQSSTWPLSTIQHVLTAPEYWQGWQDVTRDGETFRVSCPPIISREDFERVQALRVENQSHAAGLVVDDYLVLGLAWCTCPRKLGARTVRFRSGGVLRKTPLAKYVCTLKSGMPDAHDNPDCPKTVGMKKLDGWVWDFVFKLMKEHEKFLALVNEAASRMNAGQPNTVAELERLRDKLADVGPQREKVIRWARTGVISESELASQLGELDELQDAYRQALSELQPAIDKAEELRSWATSVSEFMSQVELTDLLTYDEVMAQSEDLRRDMLEDHRRIIRLLVEKIIVHRDREPDVILRYSVHSPSNELRMIGQASRDQLMLGELAGGRVYVAA